MLLAYNPDTLLGAAAILTAIGGGIASIYTVISTRKEAAEKSKDATVRAEQECYEKLLAAQREAESISDSLHDLRMRIYEATEDEHYSPDSDRFRRMARGGRTGGSVGNQQVDAGTDEDSHD